MATILHRLLAVGAIALFTFASFAVSAQLRSDHPDTYVVQRGDTLWDISARFLSKPWLWPEIWQANPQIANPHLIYPGDVISLAYLRGQPRLETQAGPRTGDYIDTVPLSDIEPFLRRLRVVDSIEGLPYIVALEEERLRSASGQLAYARGIERAEPGDMFAIVRPSQRYHISRRQGRQQGNYSARAQDLDFRGDIRQRDWEAHWSDVNYYHRDRVELGIELMDITTATVTRGAVGGIEVTSLLITDEGREVRPGDRLVRVEPQPFDLQFLPHAPSEQADYGRAQVLSVADAYRFGGPRSVVALSVGAADGVDNGTVFSLWNGGRAAPDHVANRNPIAARNDSVRLPDDYAGHAMVFRTFDRVSYALVMDGIRPVKVGAIAKHPDATR
jgi:hypothetical protein